MFCLRLGRSPFARQMLFNQILPFLFFCSKQQLRSKGTVGTMTAEQAIAEMPRHAAFLINRLTAVKPENVLPIWAQLAFISEFLQGLVST